MGSFDHSRLVVDEEGASYRQFDRISLGRCTYHDHWHHRQHGTAAVLVVFLFMLQSKCAESRQQIEHHLAFRNT